MTLPYLGYSNLMYLYIYISIYVYINRIYQNFTILTEILKLSVLVDYSLIKAYIFEYLFIMMSRFEKGTLILLFIVHIVLIKKQ